MKFVGAFLILIFFQSCGIKGDPLPPAEQQTIQAAQDLTPAPALKLPTEEDPNAKPVKKKK